MSVQNAPEIKVNDDAHDEDIEVLAEDEVIDAIGVDEGLAHEEQSDGNRTNADFEEAVKYLDIDEQYTPWKGRHVARCYNPLKQSNDSSNMYFCQ